MRLSLIRPLILLFLAVPLAAAAQDTVVVTRPGRDAGGTPTERRALSVFNAEGTTRFLGRQTLGPAVVINGDVAVLDGPLRVEGTIAGQLVAINADVVLAPGAEVQGDVLVLGGSLDDSPDARIHGALEQHATGPRVRWVDSRLALADGDREREPHDRRLPRSYPSGRASVVLTTGETYNRVEGLPIHLGGRVSWGGESTDLRVEGVGVFRTATGLDVENREVGYRALGRVRWGNDRPVELGGRAFDVVAPIEDWQLHDDEVGWAAFLFHSDYRDYYLERGVAGYGRFRIGRVLTLFGEISGTDATSIATRDPWTVSRSEHPWRANPVIDDGDFTELKAGIEVDTRGDPFWEGGVRLRLEWLRGMGENLTPRDLPPEVRDPIPTQDYRYDRVFGDLRLYQPLIAGGLSLRAVGGTVLGDSPLPVQRRFSLGGPDPMPGHGFRRFACNEGVNDPAMPALCDRLLLFQAEFRSGVDFSGDDDDDAPGWDVWNRADWEEPHFVLFADAGTAWLRDDQPGTLHWDMGLGVSLGGFGVYAAQALESGQDIRVILRLHHRF